MNPLRRTRSLLQRTSAHEAGVTIVELTVVMAVLTLTIGSLLGVFLSAQRSQAYITDRSEALDELRRTMDVLSKELRQATKVVSTSTTSSISVTTYVVGMETDVQWYVTGATLYRSDPAGTKPILNRLTSNQIFTYSPSVTQPLVVLVRLRMSPKQSPNTVLELMSEVRLRNQS